MNEGTKQQIYAAADAIHKIDVIGMKAAYTRELYAHWKALCGLVVRIEADEKHAAHNAYVDGLQQADDLSALAESGTPILVCPMCGSRAVVRIRDGKHLFCNQCTEETDEDGVVVLDRDKPEHAAPIPFDLPAVLKVEKRTFHRVPVASEEFRKEQVFSDHMPGTVDFPPREETP